MTIPNYVSTLYHKIENKVRYVGKKTLDRVLETGNVLFPQSQLELALAGVPNSLGSQYGIPDNYSGDGILFAKGNGNSSGKVTVERTSRSGANTVVVYLSDGTTRELNVKRGRRVGYARYVAREFEGLDLTGGAKKTIRRALEDFT